MSTKILFACSKCFSRHPFEELSAGQQLCKDCRGSYPIVKCTYCRTEFQQISRSTGSAICKRCDQNIKQHGKPTACECCNIIAAFIGNKCQRCVSSEAKYGPAVPCDQCKQRCAFDRRDENKKVDGKLLCWLCTCSYKRALAKARQVEKDTRMNTKKRPHPEKERTKENASVKKIHRDITKQSSNKVELPEKSSNRPVINNSNSFAAAVTIDPNSSDHVVAMTTLKEQIASLQRRLTQKDKELLDKDKLITELKGKNFDKENEMRTKMKDMERLYALKVDLLNKKVASLLKEVAQLSKQTTNKKNGSANLKLEIKREKEKIREAEREKERERERERERDLENEEKEKIVDSDKDEEEKDEKSVKEEKSDKDETDKEDDRSDNEKNDDHHDKELEDGKDESGNEDQDDKDDKDDDSSDDSCSRSASPASN